MTYKRILVAVDGSEISKTALHEAITLTNAFNSDLRVISVADEYLGYAEGIAIDLEVYAESIRRYGRLVLAQMEEIVRTAGLKPDMKLIEVKNHPDIIPEQIINEADTWQADLVVIGTHGRRGFSRLLLGSVAESVVRLAHVPVLLVRSKNHHQ